MCWQMDLFRYFLSIHFHLLCIYGQFLPAFFIGLFVYVSSYCYWDPLPPTPLPPLLFLGILVSAYRIQEMLVSQMPFLYMETKTILDLFFIRILFEM